MAGADDDTPSEAHTIQRRDSEAEAEERPFDLRNYLREDILKAVDECLHEWDKDKASGVVGSSYVDPLHRCVVCTLPHGTCQHSQKWLENRCDDSILDHLPKDNVDLAMDDLSDVLQQAPVDLRDSDDRSLPPAMSNLHWETLCPQPADDLSGTKVDLSSPASRAGHTMVLLNGTGSLMEDTRLLIVFGGVSRASGEPWQQDSGANGIENATCSANRRNDHRQQALSYHADVRVFCVGLSTWHKPETTGDTPEGRYGHVSVALDSDLMWMFGGRLQGGRQDGDTYVLDVRQMCWEKTNATRHDGRGPAARVWTAGVKVRERVLLFGGADICSGRIFDDVWAWDIATRRWTEHIVVGTPPLARYGHALLACPDRQVVVLGGCCVSSTAENGLPPDNDRMQLRLRVAADNVNRAYKLEEAQLSIGALANFVELGGVSWPIGCTTNHDRLVKCKNPSGRVPVERARWRDLSRGQALLAAAVAARERDTALQEEQLRAVLHETAASSYWAKLQSRHPIEHLDAAFLDTDSMIWGANVSEQSSGSTRRNGVYTAAPVARMHFSAVTINEKVVVWGGCLPTAKRMKPVDGGVYIFDVVKRRWSRPVGEQHPDGMKPRMDAAVGQVRRAARSLFEAKQRAMTMGAPAGRTMQVLQAEAVLEANRWRVRRLVEEIRRAVPSPQPRAAHAGSTVGHRIMYFGGWGAEAAGNGEMLVLDVEQPREKQRRLEDEFHLRLERERQAREQAEAETLRRTARQEKMRKALEMARESAETKDMAAEDARSAIPELTIAPTPRLRCANSTTLWLEWDRPTVDAVGKYPADRVEYTLYMRGGFREWEEGGRVLVEYLSKAARKAAASVSTAATTTTTGQYSVTYSDSSAGERLPGHSETGHMGGNNGRDVDHEGDVQGDGDGLDSVSPRPHHQEQQQMAEKRPKHVLMPAVIIDASGGGGIYDIRWNDGEREHGVNRRRIHRAALPAPPWTIIYKGDDCRYAVEGMVPAVIIERERAFPYEVSAEFSLQTQGTEVPREKLSRHSPLVTLSTCFGGQGPLDEGGEDGRGVCVRAPVATLKARLATAKAIDDSISAGGVQSRSLSAGVNPQHGQCTGTGRGRLYL